MRFIVDKLNSLITYLKGFFVKQHQQLPFNGHHQIILVSPIGAHVLQERPYPLINPMDDLPECNFKAERDGYAFRI